MEEMNTGEKTAVNGSTKKRPWYRRAGFITLIVLAVISISAAWWVKRNIYASTFTPTTLSAREQKTLDAKLKQLDSLERTYSKDKKYRHYGNSRPLKPEPYTEKGASRDIKLTEKELNSLIAGNAEIARRVAIDLSDDLVSIKIVVPVEKGIFLLGGKTLRFSMGVILSYERNRPVVALKGISIGGIPLPNAWLGYLKHKNLFEEFGSEYGFWNLFSEGIEDIKVKEGHLRITLKE